jgi:hypothetical protein
LYITINLAVAPAPNILPNIDTTICNGSIYTYKGRDYTASTVIKDTVRSLQTGCDSIYQTINLTVTQCAVDTFYCLQGWVSGLPDNAGVRIHYRVIDTASITALSTLTAPDGSYSICGLRKGVLVQPSAESIDGFMVQEYYGDIRITDTVRGINFHYDSIPDGYYAATGIVYVDGVARAGAEIYCNTGGIGDAGTLRPYITNSYGKYTVILPKRSSFSLHPSYISGYSVSPAGGYSIQQISANISGNDFHYTPLSADDTVSWLVGALEGLPDSEQQNRTVTAIVQGTVYYVSSGIRGGYFFKGIPAHSSVMVIPPVAGGYICTPALQMLTMPSKDTIIAPFVYSREVKDTVTLCGKVTGLPDNGNILVTCFINSTLDTLRTKPNGTYCINAVEGDYVRIIPSNQSGYRFMPGMYAVRADSSKSIYDIVYMAVDSNSVNISGTVLKDGNIFDGAFVRYTINATGGNTSGVAITDAYGRYYINGVERGSEITVTPDYVLLHRVSPQNQIIDNLEKDSVLETFNYVSFADSVYYSVSGTLYGLPAGKQSNLNIEYYVNGALSSSLLFTDVNGRYSIDSIADRSYIRVKAPQVDGYNVYPSEYTSIGVSPSYYGANFVYSAKQDTVTVPQLSDTAKLESLTIGGESQVITDIIRYVLPCDDTRTSIDVVLKVSQYDTIYGNGTTTALTYTDEYEYTYTVDISANALYRGDTITVVSTGSGTAGQLTHRYIITVEKRFAFYDVVTEYIENRIFMVINNPNNNGGYRFSSYRWYRNDILCGTEQTLSSGPGYESRFSDSPNARYRVDLLTVDGTALRTCEGKSGVTVYTPAIYPNPVRKGSTVRFTGSINTDVYKNAVLYSVQGRKIWELPASRIAEGFSTPSAVGTYILILSGENGSARFKLIVE